MSVLTLEGCALGRLAPVDVEVARGDVVALVGDADDAVGALLLCALGLAPARQGRVRLFNIDVIGGDHDLLLSLRGRAALASSQAPLLSNLTVRDNLIVPLAMRSRAEADAHDAVDALLTELELADTLGKRPHELTARQHRELLLARALLLPVELYLLDEPPLSSRLLGRLPALVAAGAAVVLTTTSERLLRGLSSSLPALRVIRLATVPTVGIG
ncbi:MAG: ATP-binding cassette domain-containing protein [Deltaproteobacteria bacterium]|nr:ATP-binding cassette domain-containing protein [Deltaproteobacteria bacterium]